MEPRISIITLGVNNIKESYKFYHEALGFPTSAKADDPIIFLKTSGTCVALYPIEKLAEDIKDDLPKQKSEFSGITLAQCTRTKEDLKQNLVSYVFLAQCTRTKEEVDEILRLAQKAGGKIVKEGQDTFWGGYHGYFSDPDGYFWEVAYADFWEFDNDGSLIIK